MTSGTIRRILILLLAPVICHAGSDLEALLASLARTAPAHTAFVEVRFSRLLNEPLIVRGELEYLGETHLVRNITAPFKERTEILGESVHVERDGQAPRRFSLHRASELRSLLNGFAGLLAGNRAALGRDFEMQLQASTSHWKLILTPRSSQARRHLTHMIIDGESDVPRCIRVTEADRDASFMLLGETQVTGLPSPLERAGLERYCEGRGD